MVRHVYRMEDTQLHKITLYEEHEYGERLSDGQQKRYKDYYYHYIFQDGTDNSQKDHITIDKISYMHCSRK